ncbi:hypothetical protein MMC10_010129 [Thelotrema lepadinum]|nr:hypothetical protein [Thelotrema lepadinum]
MDEPIFYLLDSLHTLNGDEAEQWLGRIVKSYRDPEKANSPKDTQKIRSEPKKDDAIRSLYQRIKRHEGTSVHVTLTDMLGLSNNRTKSSEPSFESQQVERHYLDQIEDVKHRLEEDEVAKSKLGDWISIAQPVYLVAGVLVADQVKYNEGKSEEKKTEASLEPLSKELAHAMGLPPQANIKAQVSRETSTEQSRTTTLVGRRIFAVEYVVLRKRLTKRSATNWRSMPRVEGTFSHGEDEGASQAAGASCVKEETASFEILVDEDPISQFDEAEEMCFDLGLEEEVGETRAGRGGKE